ncbi:condensation domain-containing protein [Anaeromicropila populeti]|uniref:Uncharacterized protein, contains a NRPS condensation (Elongation) domain n=1 Tax=Anaeromicropila populeti TaxID=37658 RepID=A0A1I6J7V1_9FIRM|nr:condensation domain-containing protein [Anaeromicropila populeti]SFR75058.1 Uncharacterized protein, contains a NRPS condensation (elongation) domain [Anaeromicropila populeti]
MKHNKKIPMYFNDVASLFANYFSDGQINFAFYFEGYLDKERLEQAISLLPETFPVLRSIVKKEEGSYFREKTNKEIVLECTESDNSEKAIEAFLLKGFQLEEEVPIRFLLIHEEKRDILCMKVDHTIAGGEGVKYLCYALAQLYKNKTISFPVNPNRDPEQITDLFDKEMKEQLLAREVYKMPVQLAPVYDYKKENLFYITRQIESELYHKINRDTKKYNVKMNDIFLAAMYFALFNSYEVPEHVKIPIMVSISMGRYLPVEEQIALSNFWGMFFTEVAYRKNLSNEELLQLVNKCTTDCKKDDSGLASFLHSQWQMEHDLEGMEKQLQAMGKTGTQYYSLSNMGIVNEEYLDFGDVSVEMLKCFGPPQCPPGGLFTIMTFKNQINLCCTSFDTGGYKKNIQNIMEYFLLYLRSI